MNFSEHQIGTIALPEHEFDTITLGSLENVTTGIGSEIKFIVTRERTGVYRVFAASVEKMKYHADILQAERKTHDEVVGGGRIVTDTTDAGATLFFGNFSEAFGSVPPALNRKIEEITINTLRGHFKVEALRITASTLRKNEVHTEPNSIFSPIMNLSWLRYTEIYEQGCQFFQTQSQNKNTHHGTLVMDDMLENMHTSYSDCCTQMDLQNYDNAKSIYTNWRYLAELWNECWRIQAVDTTPKANATALPKTKSVETEVGNNEEAPF